MPSSTMLRTPGRVVAMMLMAQVGAAASGPPRQEDEAKQVQAEPTRTGKERLGGKAFDEQRVDNCKVPPELRGPTPRPDDCDDGASARSRR
jgi:hypothetical protein